MEIANDQYRKFGFLLAARCVTALCLCLNPSGLGAINS